MGKGGGGGGWWRGACCDNIGFAALTEVCGLGVPSSSLCSFSYILYLPNKESMASVISR